VIEEPITFKNEKGEKLFGIVHIPEKSPLREKKIGINLLNPGIKYRVAPHRLNVKLARRLCQKGYYVLRFDPCGVGDSEGELPENCLVPDIWEKIQTGHFVNDTITANNIFINNYKLDKLFLMGSCGGAITALLTSRDYQRIDALCLIDIPINLRTGKMSFADKVAEEGDRMDWFFVEYLKRLSSLRSWYRFMTFQTNYRAAWKVLRNKFQKKFHLFQGDSQQLQNPRKLWQEQNLNMLFFESFERFIENKKRILFIIAGNDPGTEIFHHYFQYGYLRDKGGNTDSDNLIGIFLVENANHIYTLTEWQESLIEKVLSWIDG